MAGVKGRSGGRNRKSVEQHKREGSYQPSRHQERPTTVGTRARIGDQEQSYRHVKQTLASLRTTLDAALKKGTPCAPLLREVRYQTALLLQLGAFLNNQDRLLPQEAETAVDPFDQFETR